MYCCKDEPYWCVRSVFIRPSVWTGGCWAYRAAQRMNQEKKVIHATEMAILLLAQLLPTTAPRPHVNIISTDAGLSEVTRFQMAHLWYSGRWDNSWFLCSPVGAGLPQRTDLLRLMARTYCDSRYTKHEIVSFILIFEYRSR